MGGRGIAILNRLSVFPPTAGPGAAAHHCLPDGGQHVLHAVARPQLRRVEIRQQGLTGQSALDVGWFSSVFAAWPCGNFPQHNPTGRLSGRGCHSDVNWESEQTLPRGVLSPELGCRNLAWASDVLPGENAHSALGPAQGGPG